MGVPQPGDMRRMAAVGDRPAGDETVGLRRSWGHLVSAVVPIGASSLLPTSRSRLVELLGGRSRPGTVRGQVLWRHGVADEPDAFLVVALNDGPEAGTEPAVGLRGHLDELARAVADVGVVTGWWCTPAQYTGLLRDQDDPYAEAGMDRVFRGGPKRAGRWAVRHPSGGFSCTVSLNPSPETPPEVVLGAVTASLTGRYVVTTTIEEVSAGVPLSAPQREDPDQKDRRWPRHDEPQGARMLARREKQSGSFYRFTTLLTVTAPLPAQLHRAIADLTATAGGLRCSTTNWPPTPRRCRWHGSTGHAVACGAE
jgi:hypothetical protein